MVWGILKVGMEVSMKVSFRRVGLLKIVIMNDVKRIIQLIVRMNSR